MGTKRGIPYSFLFWCPWLPLKTAFKETSEKASYTLQPLRLDPSFASFLKHWPSSPADSCMLPSFSYHYLRTKKTYSIEEGCKDPFPRDAKCKDILFPSSPNSQLQRLPAIILRVFLMVLREWPLGIPRPSDPRNSKWTW